MRFYLSCLTLIFILSCNAPVQPNNQVKGLIGSVEIVRDSLGINHIYAQNQHDLFFMQGYAAAKDRLFQFEIWRRQATGTVAEILGERELNRDIGTRLFMFRGDMKKEMNHYHEEGEEIITAYTDGVNAYIEEALQNPDQLPLEFQMLGIKPQKWTPEVVISRHQGLLGNIKAELQIGRSVAAIGVEKTKDLHFFQPKDPIVDLDPLINKESLFNDILGLYNAYRKSVSFEAEDLLPAYRSTAAVDQLNQEQKVRFRLSDSLSIGSNNWVMRAEKMADGQTYMANDPHRTIAVPSLRYMAHLVAPGWDVIGGGEPEIPGISIGHNEYGAWGLTVFRTDGEDLMVYQLNPENLNQYKYQGNWEDMEVIEETFLVKGKEEVKVKLNYTRHGPVSFIDSANHIAYAVRCAWLEPGGAPYLASLRMDQAKTWEEFRDACNYSNIPGENMVWADKEGNIGWQAVGIAPIRRNFSGLVPVPGDGRYEWDGYLPIIQKPNDYNPANGFIATSNQNITPPDYEHWDAIGFYWTDHFRGERTREVLGADKKFTMEDMKALQTDYLSLPARTLVPLLLDIEMENQAADAQALLKDWDYIMDLKSIPASIYVAFENHLMKHVRDRFVPEAAKDIIGEIQLQQIVGWLVAPDERFGSNPEAGRDAFLHEAFELGIAYLEEQIGSDMDAWQYGQEKLKHIELKHAVGKVAGAPWAEQLNLPMYLRGGNNYTPNHTGTGYLQTKGATFRMIVNTGDWDAAVGTNSPGQSGDPGSPFYSNLYEGWAKDQYFPMYYSREKIESIAYSKEKFTP